jgi:hypothetical protein
VEAVTDDDDNQRLWRLFALALQGDTTRTDKLAQHFTTPEDYLDAWDKDRDADQPLDGTRMAELVEQDFKTFSLDPLTPIGPAENEIRYAYHIVQMICGDLDLIEIDEIVQRVREEIDDG